MKEEGAGLRAVKRGRFCTHALLLSGLQGGRLTAAMMRRRMTARALMPRSRGKRPPQPLAPSSPLSPLPLLLLPPPPLLLLLLLVPGRLPTSCRRFGKQQRVHLF